MPGAALALETGIERGRVAQTLCVAWLQKFQEQGAEANRKAHPRQRPCQAKPEAKESFLLLVEREHPTVERQQAGTVLQFGQRRRPADNRDPFDPFRNRPAARVSVRRSAGNRENTKSLDAKTARQTRHHRWPVEELPVRHEFRATNPRAIG